jgi:hypothetical protein
MQIENEAFDKSVLTVLDMKSEFIQYPERDERITNLLLMLLQSR